MSPALINVSLYWSSLKNNNTYIVMTSICRSIDSMVGSLVLPLLQYVLARDQLAVRKGTEDSTVHIFVAE